MSEPANPPLPTPSYLPFQEASGGNQTSKAMSESEDGLIAPWTRQNGAFTATGVGGSLPTTLDGGDTLVAAVIVASPKVFPASAPQSAACAPPPAKESAHAATALKPAKRALRYAHPDLAFDMAFSPIASAESPGARSPET